MPSRIFISYSWADRDVADHIDRELERYNIDIVRDVRDLEYKGSIATFMTQVRQSDYVLMLISDSFLRSPNCMFEVLEFIKDESFRDRILPLVAEEADIFSSERQLVYLEWWQEHYEALALKKSRFDEIHTIPLAERLKFIDAIRRELLEFLTTVAGMRVRTYRESVDPDAIAEIASYIGVSAQPVHRHILHIRSPDVFVMEPGEAVHTLSQAFGGAVAFDVLRRTSHGDNYAFTPPKSIDAADFSDQLKKANPYLRIDFLEVFPDSDAYLICCVERTATSKLVVWWKPYEYGYTTFVPEAGIYSLEQARTIIDRCDPGSQLALPMIFVEEGLGRTTVRADEKFRAAASRGVVLKRSH